MTTTTRTSPVFFRHVRFADVSIPGAITAAVQLSPDETTAVIAFAECSPKDQFNRSKGRIIAEGRLKKESRAICVHTDKDRDGRPCISRAVLHAWEYNKEKSRWASRQVMVLENGFLYLA